MSKGKRANALARHVRVGARLLNRVHLLWFEPEIRRRISLKSDLTHYQVHEVLQVILEWEHDHLHGFGAWREGKPDATHAPPGDALKASPVPGRDVQESTLRRGTLLRRDGSTLHDTCDRMTGWAHVLTVEERRLAIAEELRSQFLAGEGRSPSGASRARNCSGRALPPGIPVARRGWKRSTPSTVTSSTHHGVQPFNPFSTGE